MLILMMALIKGAGCVGPQSLTLPPQGIRQLFIPSVALLLEEVPWAVWTNLFSSRIFLPLTPKQTLDRSYLLSDTLSGSVQTHITAVLYYSHTYITADWRYRHAGLMALSAIGEGCHQQMESILNEIVSFVLLFCQDPVSI